MKSILIILLLSSCILAGHHGNHKCIHDQISKRIPNREVDHVEVSDEERNLQSSKPARNMIISYDFSFFNKLSSSPQDQLFKQVAEKAIQISIDYLNKLLTIVPKPAGQMKWTKKFMQCGEVTIPQSDADSDKDSDLHLYISFTDEPQESYLAYAGWCRFLSTYGATHGKVNFNKGVLQKQNFNDPIIYQDLIQTTIHEIIHVLGFSDIDINYWVDSKKVRHVNPTVTSSVRGKETTFIRTPNVLAAAQKYFNCTSIQGMPVENNGSSGSSGSHWETTAILDEMMNPAASETNSIMSVFTLALLKDTGFYASVNDQMEEPSFYGKNKGCSFVNGVCSSQQKEFCSIGSSNTCDFYSHGESRCAKTFFTDSGCSTWQAYSNLRCFDQKNQQNTPTNQNKLGVGFGHNSKCFVSSLYQSSFRSGIEQPLCYQYECTADQKVVVKVGSQTTVCSQNGEQVKVTGFSGTLTCPDNLSQFCGFKKFCPDHCSSNGYCVNGICMCNKGYSGINCSVKA